MREILIGLVVAGSIAGCGTVGGVTCSTVLRPGLSISLVDSISGGPITTSDLMVIATSPGHADTVRAQIGPSAAGIPISIVQDQAGVYSVEIMADGFLRWALNAVEVFNEDQCHVRTVELTARLQPA